MGGLIGGGMPVCSLLQVVWCPPYNHKRLKTWIMIAFKVALTCASCQTQFETTVYKHKSPVVCANCGAEQGEVKPIKGFIYVAANSKQPGFAKVGLTTKDPEQRMKEISRGAGSIGEWTVAALFPSNRPDFDEKRCHKKLERQREKSEVFAIDPADASVKVRTTLGREPIEVAEEYLPAYEARRAKNKSRAKHLRDVEAAEKETDVSRTPEQGELKLGGRVNQEISKGGFLSGLFR